MTKSTTRELRTLRDVVRVTTPANAGDLIETFRLFITAIAICKEKGIPVSNASLTWTDDGKPGLTGLTYVVRDKTGLEMSLSKKF